MRWHLGCWPPPFNVQRQLNIAKRLKFCILAFLQRLRQGVDGLTSPHEKSSIKCAIYKLVLHLILDSTKAQTARRAKMGLINSLVNYVYPGIGVLLILSALAMPANSAQDASPDPLSAIASDNLLERRVIGSSIESPIVENPIPQIRETLRQLSNKVRKADQVRVIVGVRAAFAPEGYQDSNTRRLQRQEIGAVQSIIEKALPRRDSARIRKITSAPFMTMEVDADQIEALAAMPEVTDIQEDRVAWASLAQSVPVIQADDAWSAGYTGSGWAVAVLDNGVQKSQPFLQAAVVSEVCYSTQNPNAGEYSLCPGRVTASTASGAASYCTDATYGNWACDHGTHVAGIPAGRGGNQTFAGVAKGGNLFPIQVFTYDASSGDPYAWSVS